MIIRKIILLGEIGVGKTSIARRLAFDKFSEIYRATIGADLYRYEVTPPPLPGVPFHFVVWDTDGSHDEDIFRLFYARQAQAAMIVGDVTRPATIDTMLRLGHRFAEEVPGRFFAHILNKIDLTDDEPPRDLVERLQETKVPLYVVSAKINKDNDVAHAFTKAATEIVKLEGLGKVN